MLKLVVRRLLSAIAVLFVVANVIVQSQINSFGMLAMAAYGAHCKI